MALNNSGPISIGGPTAGQSINLELERSATQQSALEEKSLRQLAGQKTTGSTISMSDFYGKSNHWIFTTGGPYQERFLCLCIDDDGGIIAGGQYTTLSTDDAWIVKLNTNGSVAWQKRISGGDAPDLIAGVSTNSDGNIYAAFYNYINQSILVKISADGTVSTGSKRIYPFFVRASTLNASKTSLITVGKASGYTSSQGSDDGLIFTYDTSFNRQSGRLATSNLLDTPVAIACDTANNIYTAGSIDQPGFGLLTKHGSNGDGVWYRRLQSTGTGGWNALAVDYIGNVFAAGSFRKTQTGASSYQSAVVAKYDTNGELLWKRILDQGGPQTFFNAITTDPDGNCYAVGGTTETGGNAPHKGLIVKYNSSGVLQWQRTFRHSLVDPASSLVSFYAVARFISGAIVVAGSAQLAAYPDGLVVKLPSNGSKTGTYGAYTYEASNLAEQEASGLTSVNQTMQTYSATPTEVAITPTIADTTLPSTLNAL